jgi:hypothetical protein
MMRLLTISAVLGVFLSAWAAPAQTPEIQKKVNEALAHEKEKAAALEDLLAQALKDNPDIRVAESKLREVEAELNRVRLQVTQKVVAAQRELAQRRAALAEARAVLARLQKLSDSGAAPVASLEGAQANLQKLQADLARVEDDLPFLLGRKVFHGIEKGVLLAPLDRSAEQLWLRLATGATDRPPQEPKKAEENKVQWYSAESYLELLQEQFKPSSRLPADMSDKLRKALDTPVKVDFHQASQKDFVDFLQQRAKGLNIVAHVHIFGKSEEGPMSGPGPVDLHLTEMVPLGAVFQFLEDRYDWRFVIRDYGIVITGPKHVPPGAVYLQDFWKNRSPAATASTSERKNNAPPVK